MVFQSKIEGLSLEQEIKIGLTSEQVDCFPLRDLILGLDEI